MDRTLALPLPFLPVTDTYGEKVGVAVGMVEDGMYVITEDGSPYFWTGARFLLGTSMSEGPTYDLRAAMDLAKAHRQMRENQRRVETHSTTAQTMDGYSLT